MPGIFICYRRVDSGPHAGRITFGLAEPEEARSGGMHFVGHQDGLKTQRLAREELTFQALWCGGTAASIEAAIEDLQLKPLLELEVRKLSAGQRRRLALARLLVTDRLIWLLDEPTASLDAAGDVLVERLVAERLRTGGAVIAATHDGIGGATSTLTLGAAL